MHNFFFILKYIAQSFLYVSTSPVVWKSVYRRTKYEINYFFIYFLLFIASSKLSKTFDCCITQGPSPYDGKNILNFCFKMFQLPIQFHSLFRTIFVVPWTSHLELKQLSVRSSGTLLIHSACDIFEMSEK